MIINQGEHISYQRHNYRTEVWILTEGAGILILDGNVQYVSCGDVVIIKAGMKHAIKSITNLHIIEVQMGNELAEEDIECFDWTWKDKQVDR